MNNAKKNTGFKVPLFYFKTLEEKILNNVKEGVNVQNNFFVPYNYFKNFKFDSLGETKSLRFKKNLLFIGSGFSIVLMIILFMVFIQNKQEEKIKNDYFYTDIERELRINTLKAFQISRSIESINYGTDNSDLNNSKANQIDPNQIYFNNSFNIYYEEIDY